MSHIAAGGPDGDGSGSGLSSPLSSPTRASLMARSLFASLDGDGDGWLQRSDLAAFIEDEGKLDEIAQIMDPENTGRIDLHAFERCFDMFGAEDDDDNDEQQQESESVDPPAAAAAAPVPVVKAPAPRRHVSFGEADAAARVSISGTSRAGGITIPPAGAKKAGALKTQNMTLRPSSKKLLLKKGYASLKHALILDELRSSPALGPMSPPPPHPGSSAELTIPAVALPASATSASTLRVPSPSPSPIPSPSGAPLHRRGHSRQQSSTDYSFHYSKSHTSLMQRANKILAWCADTEGAEAAAAAADPASSSGSASPSSPSASGPLGSRPTATISVSELETTIHYLARSFTPAETAALQQMLAVHGVAALPVQLFRQVIATCIDKEEADKAALVRDAKAARMAATASSLTTAAVAGSPSPSPDSTRREFDPDAFVSEFLSQLAHKVEMLGVKIAPPPPPAHNPNVLASFSPISPATAGGAGGAGSASSTAGADSNGVVESSEGELVLSQLRQSLRLLENESRNLKHKYDFNLVFTKQLEAENFTLRSRLDEALLESSRRDEAATETREALEAHRSFLAGVERSKAALEAEVSALREDAQSSQAMLQLERRKAHKLAFDVEKLQGQLQNLQHVRNASSRAKFREGLEEMRKNLGSLRFQRQLQAENARVGVIEAEKAEALAANRALEATIAEQQRILNELQREKLTRLSVSESPVRGERSSVSMLSSPVEQQRTRAGATVNARLLAVPVLPQHNRGSLSEDLREDEDEEAGSGGDAAAAADAAADARADNNGHATGGSSDDEWRAQDAEQEHRELLEQLASVRAQLLAAQSQLQSSRTSRVQVESSFSVAQQSIVQLQEALSEKDAALTTLRDSIPALTAKAEQEAARAREEVAAAARTHANEVAAKSQQAAKAAQELVTRHEAAINAQRAQHASTLAALEVAHQEALMAHKTQVRSEADAQLAQQVAFLQKQHASALAEQDDQHRHALQALQTQLNEAVTSARDASTRASADLAAVERAHQSRLAEAQSDFARTLEEVRGDLTAARAATRLAEEALLASRQAARDHVCAPSSSVSGENAVLQESLSKAQALSRDLETQMSELRREHVASVDKVAAVHKQMEEVRAEASRREGQASQVASEAQAQVAQVQTQLGALQQSHGELTTQHAALQVSLRQSKASVAELTLQLSSLQMHEQSMRESSELQSRNLSQLVDQWRDECEKRKTSAEQAKKEAARVTEELEARIKALEAERAHLKHTIATHVCGTPTAAGGAGVGMGMASGGSSRATTPSASPPTIRIISPSPSPALGGDLQSLGSPLASSSLSLLGSNAAPAASGSVVPLSAAPAPAPAPAPVVVSPFAQSGLSSAHVLEIHAYACFISRTLGSDPDLRHLFPLDVSDSSLPPVLPALVHDFAGCGVDLLRKMRDGLLIAKLINAVAPRTIDERVLNKRGEVGVGGGSVGWKSIVENLNVCITSAKSLGITMRVPQEGAAADAFGGGELDASTGMVRTAGGQRMSIGSEADLSSSDASSPLVVPSPSSAQSQYVGVELGSAQLVLMSCESSLENLDIVLDFLFQLLRQRMLHGPFAQVSRLAGLLRLPALPADLRRKMMDRTVSLLPAMEPTSSAAAGTRKPAPSPRNKSTMSKFATLSKLQPANLSSAEHKRFVAHFGATILADFESTNDLHCLTPEQLLLRWINSALMQQAMAAPSGSSAAAGVHFVAHLSDMDVTSYALLLSQVDAWRAAHTADGAPLPDSERFDFDSASSASVLAHLGGPLQVAHFHSPASIASKHERLTLLLLALLFHAWPMLDDAAATASNAAFNVTVTRAQTAPGQTGQVRRLSMGHEPSAGSAGASASATSGASGTAGAASTSDSSRGSVASSSSSASSSSASSYLPPLVDGLSEEEGEGVLLRSYLNSCGILGVSINNLFHDVRTGLVLLRLLDWLEAGCVDWRQVERNPTNKFKCISNLNAFLQICRDHLHIHFVNIGAVDIYSESNAKYVLAIVWQLLRFNTIQKLKEIRSRIPVGEDGVGAGRGGLGVSAAKEITDASILEWANQKVASRPHALAVAHRCAHVSSLGDSALRNSLFLLNLLDNLQEGCVDWNLVEVASAAVDPADVPALLTRNASYAISIARKLGAELFALPQDIVNANKKQLVLILASLMACEYGLETAR